MPARAVDVLLDAFAIRLTEGHSAAAPTLASALQRLLALRPGADIDVGSWLWLAGYRAGGIVAGELWDDEAWHTLAAAQVEVARGAGALVQLQYAAELPGLVARRSRRTGGGGAAVGRGSADRGGDRHLTGRVLRAGPRRVAGRRGHGGPADRGHNQARRLPRHGQAAHGGRPRERGAVQRAGPLRRRANGGRLRAFERDELGYGPFLVAELAEAASRTNDAQLLDMLLHHMSQRAAATPTDWATGTESVRAGPGLATATPRRPATGSRSSGSAGPGMTGRLARVHLLYGQWLRRKKRRLDARHHLRLAHEMLTAMGAEGFAEQARRELQATGATVRKPPVATVVVLTAQEAQIARLVTGRAVQSRDQHPAVPQPAHRRMASAQGVHQARHQLTPAAPRSPARRRATGPLDLTPQSGPADDGTSVSNRCDPVGLRRRPSPFLVPAVLVAVMSAAMLMPVVIYLAGVFIKDRGIR